jgi:hypothetical protein
MKHKQGKKLFDCRILFKPRSSEEREVLEQKTLNSRDSVTLPHVFAGRGGFITFVS